ncbi:hypothetical protein Tco_1367424 [Tanacetum coccineum]
MGCQGGGYKILKMSKHNVHFISKVQVEVTIVETTNTSGAMIVMMVVEKRMTHDRKDDFEVDVFLNGAFGGVGDEEVGVGEGIVVTSSSLEMLTNNCLGGMIVNLIFLEGFKEEAFVSHVEFVLRKMKMIKDDRRSFMI